MIGKNVMAGTAMLLVLQPVLAGPMAYKSPEPIQQREEIIVDPPKNITPTIDKITNLTEDQLQDLIDDVNGGSNKTFGKREPVSPRQTAANGAFLSFDGGLEDPNCANFTIDGPFTSIHMFMGSTNIRAITVTSADGTTTTVTGGLETVVDAGEFTFASNERITKLSIARVDSRVSGLTFETDGGNKYEAASSNIQDGTFTPTYTDVPVGAGIMARLRGNKCGSSVFSKLGIDMLDELDSISISNIDYEGFTNNIMPTSGGTQVSVGSQILDNRNSSIEQTISLQTTDAVTRQTTVTAQKHWQVGGSVSLSAKAGIPLIGGTTVTTETNWQVQELSSTAEMESFVTTRAATFSLACPAGQFCTSRAFFTQFKLDVNMNATFTATTKTGATYDWVQSGQYKGADSLAMQFNITEVENVS